MKCTKCKKEKIDSDFSFKNQILGIKHKQCKTCTRLLIKNHYNYNKNYYLEKTRKRNAGLRLNISIFIKEYLLNHPCVDCGETDPVVLEFDHNGKVPKFKAVSLLIRSIYPIKKIQDEINKCDVRCANCHRRKTSKDFKWFKARSPL